MADESHKKLSREELDELAGEALPERAAMSLVNANIAIPINAAVAANVLSDGGSRTRPLQRTRPSTRARANEPASQGARFPFRSTALTACNGKTAPADARLLAVRTLLVPGRLRGSLGTLGRRHLRDRTGLADVRGDRRVHVTLDCRSADCAAETLLDDRLNVHPSSITVPAG